MRGREWGGEERMVEAVDLPVAMLPVRAMRSMLLVGVLWCARIGEGGEVVMVMGGRVGD